MGLTRKSQVALSDNTIGHIVALVQQKLRTLWEYKPSRVVTIAGGIITVEDVFTLVDTAGGAGSDDLDTINGGKQGGFLVIGAYNTARSIVLKHATGNIHIRAGADITLDNTEKLVLLFNPDGTKWVDV